MSALLTHAKAARALAEAFAFEGNESRSRVLLLISSAYTRAAESMERRARAEAGEGPCRCEGGDVLEGPVGVFVCCGCGRPREGWKA
jgi:hypothetical protein